MLERVLRLIVVERKKVEQFVIRGMCDDLPSYREKFGRIAAFADAERIIGEQIERENERNEE